MIIKSLEQMEKIVRTNRFLFWDGWTVVENNFKLNGAVSPNGAYVKGKWIVQHRVEVTEDGWNVPKRFIR